MQTTEQKQEIVREAFRVLRPGGRYGIHEMALHPDDLPGERKAVIQRDLSGAIRVGARPLTRSEWRALLETEGFEVLAEEVAPMHLLEPRRLIADEGIRGAARIALNLLREPAARERVIGMRQVFQQHADAMCGVMLVARKPA